MALRCLGSSGSIDFLPINLKWSALAIFGDPLEGPKSSFQSILTQLTPRNGNPDFAVSEWLEEVSWKHVWIEHFI